MAFLDHEVNCPVLDPALAVSAVDATKAKVWATCLVKIGWDLSRPIVADTDLTALVGTISDDFQAIFTFWVKYNATTGLNEYTVEKSDDKAKTLKMNTWETKKLNNEYAILWFMLVINESWADFVWGTTELTATGITTVFVDYFGFVGS